MTQLLTAVRRIVRMESDSSGESATPYQTLISSVRRRQVAEGGGRRQQGAEGGGRRQQGAEGGVKRRQKSVGATKKGRVTSEVAQRCEVAESEQSEGEETELSQSDSEECKDPFYHNLSYQLTDSDITLLATPLPPLLVPDHPLGHVTLHPSPLPSCPLSADTATQIHLRAKILRRLCSPKSSQTTPEETLTETQRHLLHHLGQYSDILYSRETHERHTELLEAVVAHLVSHVSKGRRLVLRNNKRATQGSEPPRDQGLVRPRVLVLVPFRSHALQVVHLMARLCGGVSHRRRLEAEYGPGEEIVDPSKPPEYRHLFEGNSDDCFKMGVALYSDTLRLFAPFYASDIIVASPLGLRTLVGAEGDRREADFLSSLEIVLLDHTDVFLMQNWSHVVSLLRATHCKPHDLHGTDIQRIRPWALDQRGHLYCQLIVLSRLATPEIHALFRARATSRHHKVVITPPEYPGVLRHIRHQIPQVSVHPDTFYATYHVSS